MIDNQKTISLDPSNVYGISAEPVLPEINFSPSKSFLVDQLLTLEMG
jgi:hypothetical protein